MNIVESTFCRDCSFPIICEQCFNIFFFQINSKSRIRIRWEVVIGDKKSVLFFVLANWFEREREKRWERYSIQERVDYKLNYSVRYFHFLWTRCRWTCSLWNRNIMEVYSNSNVFQKVCTLSSKTKFLLIQSTFLSLILSLLLSILSLLKLNLSS